MWLGFPSHISIFYAFNICYNSMKISVVPGVGSVVPGVGAVVSSGVGLAVVVGLGVVVGFLMVVDSGVLVTESGSVD